MARLNQMCASSHARPVCICRFHSPPPPPPPPPLPIGSCLVFSYSCTRAAASSFGCVYGSTTLSQQAIPVGSCPSTLSLLRSSYSSILQSVYVCNTTNCNSGASLLGMQASSPPPPPLSLSVTTSQRIYVAAAVSLGGYTPVTFDAVAATVFVRVLATSLGTQRSDIIITSVTAFSRRHLLAASGVNVAFSVAASSAAAATAATAAVNSLATSAGRVALLSSLFSACSAANVPAPTSIVLSAAPTITSAAVLPAAGYALPSDVGASPPNTSGAGVAAPLMAALWVVPAVLQF